MRRPFLLCFLLIIITFLSTVVEVEAFAAAKKGGGKKKPQKSSSASTNRGFGAPPPTLEETLAGFKTSIPENAAELPCPCGTSSATYENCCQPLHDDPTKCQTPLDVLKSRYSAFSYRKIGHILATTHPKCRDYQQDKVAWAKDLNKAGMFDSFDFVKLEVMEEESSRDNDKAYIDFQVTMRGRDNNVEQRSAASVAGEETTIRERSQFLRDSSSGAWTYSGGDVRSGVEGLEDVTLNT
ncbi:MAG: hypothetical protein SGILL_008745 [Bacillariaceae sp.]